MSATAYHLVGIHTVLRLPPPSFLRSLPPPPAITPLKRPPLRTAALKAKKVLEVEESATKLSIDDYFDQAAALIESDDAGGPPRWFSPVECGGGAPRKFDKCPLLLYLPGIDGLGLGLILQHQKLAKIFDVLCLHIPVKDRTPFQDLVRLVEETVISENCRFPGRPIYLVGESIGACLALAVAARNPTIDLVLILANPATSFTKSQLQYVLPLLEFIPSELSLISSIPYVFSLITGEPFKTATAGLAKGLQLEEVYQGLFKQSSHFSVAGRG